VNTNRTTTRHRFDHAAAKAYFVSLSPAERSSRAVAERFGVTVRTIRKWRERDDWDSAASAADASAAAALERQAVKTREQRALQDARIRDRAAQRVETRLDAEDVGDDWVRQVLQDADRRVRLNEGEATDHVAVAVVQAGFRESLAAAAQLVADLVGQGLEQNELVRVFRAELPARVQERLALIGGDEGA
jgi:transposase